MKDKRKWTLAILGTVFLGAVGSGLWDVFFKPVLFRGTDVLLTIVTLGLSVVKDSAYQKISLGFREEPSALSHTLLVLGLTTLVLISYGLTVAMTNERARRLRVRGMSADERERWEANHGGKLDRLEKQLTKLVHPLGLSGLLAASFLLVQSLLGAYCNAAIAHYRQSLAICRPYLEPGEADVIESRFALIRSKDDYVGVLARLDEVADANGVELLEFEPW